MISQNFICIDDISTCYTPDAIIHMFKYIATIGNVYIHYHANPNIKVESPCWWFNSGSQTVWLTIREWSDNEYAHIIYKLLLQGKTTIPTALGKKSIEMEFTGLKDMLRFPIDVHFQNDEDTTFNYRLDANFDNLLFKTREPKHFVPKLMRQTNWKQTLRPAFIEPKPTQNPTTNNTNNKLSLIHPDLLIINNSNH